MNLADVKVGDRCWSVDGSNTPDQFNQNATVVSLESFGVRIVKDRNRTSEVKTPGISVFWCKPEAPPKPKRKVKKEYVRYTTAGDMERLERGEGVTLWRTAVGSPFKVIVTVEVEE